MNHSASLVHRDVVTSQLLQNSYLPPFQEFENTIFEASAVGKARIAFGSCNDQSRLNPFWPVLEERNPTAFIWGGDAIYSDFELPIDWSQFPPVYGGLSCADETRLRSLYKEMHEVPGYKSFLNNTHVTVFGTYDDHDYGCNNADRTFEHKHGSAMAYVDFLREPQESAMAKRARDGQGVYGVKLFDFARPVGQQLVAEEDAGIDPDLQNINSPANLSNMTVAVFVLDCRFHKTPWLQGRSRYKPDLKGDFLGERQWQWFERAIRRSRASVNIVVNGLQVHANLFPDGNLAESWSKYPSAQQRLFDAILQEGVEAPILISGDVHMAQFMRKDCQFTGDPSRPSRPLIEMTTSGMTHSWGAMSVPLMNLNYIPSFMTRYKTFVSDLMMRLLHWICPWTDLLISISKKDTDGLYENGGAEGAKQGKQFSLLKNFGELEFDWDKKTVTARVIGEDAVETPLLSAKWSLDQLSGRAHMPGSTLAIENFLSSSNLEHSWTCVSYRGDVSYGGHTLGHLITGAALIFFVPFSCLFPLCMLIFLARRGIKNNPLSFEQFTMILY